MTKISMVDYSMETIQKNSKLILYYCLILNLIMST